GSSEVLLRRFEAATRVALLGDEGAETFLFIGDAPLRRADLLAERIADPNRRAAALLHRRRLKARLFRPLRGRVVRIDGDLLTALRGREDIGGCVPRGCRNFALSRELLATAEELGALTLDRCRARLLRADQIADIRLARRQPGRGALRVFHGTPRARQ